MKRRMMDRFDGRDCPYCGRGMTRTGSPTAMNFVTRDHINPLCNGGGPYVACCFACNHDKAHLSLVEWRVVLSWRHRTIYLFNFERWMIIGMLTQVVMGARRWLATV